MRNCYVILNLFYYPMDLIYKDKKINFYLKIKNKLYNV